MQSSLSFDSVNPNTQVSNDGGIQKRRWLKWAIIIGFWIFFGLLNGNPTLLTGGVGHNIFPSWSPDGKSIIFTSHRDGPEDNMTVYTMKPDGSGLQQLSDQQAFMARFSRDGARIGFLTGRYPRNAIYVMNADGSGLRKITP